MTESPHEPQLGNATLRLNGGERLVRLIVGRFQEALEVVLGEVEATEDVDREPRLGEVPLKNAQPPEQREDDLLRPALDGVQGEAGRDGHVPLEERVPDGGDDLPPVRHGQVEGDGVEAAPVGIHGDSSTSTPGPESPTAAPTVEASRCRRDDSHVGAQDSEARLGRLHVDPSDDFLSTPRKVASGMLYDRLLREVLTVDALDAALVPVFGMLLERGVISVTVDPFAAAESVPCPRCGVDAFRPCRGHDGHVLDVPHWQRARKWEKSLDTREHRREDLARDLSRMVGFAGLAAREATR